MALASKNLIDSASSSQFRKMISTALIFAGIVLSNIIIKGFTSITVTRTQENLCNQIRRDLFIRLSKVQWLQLSKYHSEDILTRMTSDVGTIVNLVVNTIPGIFALIILMTGSVISLMILEPPLAFLALLLGPIALVFSRLFAENLKILHIKIQESESSYRSFIQECIYNMPIIKAFCIEENASNNINNLQNNRLHWILKRTRLSIYSNTFFSISFEIGYLLAFFWGAFRLSQNLITFGAFTAFLQLVGKVQGPFVDLAYTVPQIIAATASAGRLREFEALSQEQDAAFAGSLTSTGVKLENVSFGYEINKPVLKNICIEIKPGEIVGIVGKSGQGKTTLIRLLLSFIEPTEGRAYITTPLNERFEITRASRNLISYVPQGNTLFSGTIADNLRVGSPIATEKEIIQALQAACAWDFVKGLDNGINTFISEGGTGLSEGQLQRLCIARAIIKASPIFIFDEATSALDMDTEFSVLNSIKSLYPRKTCLIITHRPKALDICDRVFKIEDNYIKDYSSETVSNINSEAV
jgi:ABC-type multidrug transport system fused ATPase/permease subunit